MVLKRRCSGLRLSLGLVLEEELEEDLEEDLVLVFVAGLVEEEDLIEEEDLVEDLVEGDLVEEEGLVLVLGAGLVEEEDLVEEEGLVEEEDLVEEGLVEEDLVEEEEEVGLGGGGGLPSWSTAISSAAWSAGSFLKTVLYTSVGMVTWLVVASSSVGSSVIVLVG